MAGVLAGVFPCAAAFAQDDGLMPPEGAVEIDAQLSYDEETHPPLRLTPDKSEIIAFDENVGRVIIGNDTHLNILMDSARRIVVVPRVPGATHFTVLGADGRVLMQRHAIVAMPKAQYVRIRETCRTDMEDCMPVRMYYCPGMCHELAIVGEGNKSYSGSIAVTDRETKKDKTKETDDKDVSPDKTPTQQ